MNQVSMRRKEREVTNLDYIEEMLKIFDTVNVGMNDEDGYPYVVPMNYGFERTETSFIFYLHCAKQGHKIDVLSKDNRVCLTMSEFQDFPDEPFKGFKHDYRSVIAKGNVEIVDGNEMFEKYMVAHETLQVGNHRDFDYEKYAKRVNAMYMLRVEVPFENIRAKSEFPINSIEDVHFKKIGRKKPL